MVWVSVPTSGIMVIRPRNTYPKPMVSMTMENAGCPRMGRITMRSSKTPKTPMATMAAGTDNQKGKPSSVMAARPEKAPTIIRSPWAKLTVSVAL